jgi:hypothetical protein
VSNGCLQILCPQDRWNKNPDVWDDIGKDGMTTSILCFRMGKTVPKYCDEEEIASHVKNFSAPLKNLNPNQSTDQFTPFTESSLSSC